MKKRALTYTIIGGSKACTYNCPICISKMTPSHGIGYKEPKINWRNFDLAKDIALNYEVENLLITGKGEPTLFPDQITKFLKQLKGERFNKRELQTNGSLIATGKLDDKLKEWYDNKLVTVAVSVYHYDNKKNQEVFRPKSGKYFDLEKLIEKLHKNNLEIRLSCVMLKNYIDRPEEAEKLLEFADKNGVQQATFRTADIPRNPADLYVANYVKENKLTKKQSRKVGKFIAKKGGGKPCDVLSFGANVYEIGKKSVATTTGLTPYRGGERLVQLVRSILGKDDEIRQLIFFPQGLLTTSWETIYGSAILRGWSNE